ncbi:oxidoreductase [Mumia sp. ZJ1417]|uniref:oxidoreductase n=1 Tax=Mumia sp. ZJ1417 TaxID=2708082 RepID=UPI001421AD03|nr:oxidoreductase [Mumia sp. ZJ1417]QMW66702.1 oxidoreductase [Mumia sp. ZJ1417]
MPDPFSALTALDGVPSAFAATRDGLDSLLRDRGLRRSTPEMTADSLLLGAAASAAIDGAPYDPDGLRRGEADPLALAVARMSTELLSLVPTWHKAPLQAIARIHALVARGRVSDDELGRPVSPEGARRLGTLAQAVVAPTEAPGLLVASVVHAEIATAGAFVSDNGIVARAAERLVIVAKGVDPASLTVPEAGHRAAGAGYTKLLGEYESEGTAGVHKWLLYAAQAYADGAEAAPVEPPKGPRSRS